MMPAPVSDGAVPRSRIIPISPGRRMPAGPSLLIPSNAIEPN